MNLYRDTCKDTLEDCQHLSRHLTTCDTMLKFKESLFEAVSSALREITTI